MSELTLEQRMEDAHNVFMEAGARWQAASVELIEEKVLERFPTAKWAELTVILDESYTEHSIEVFDEQDNELTANVDFPDDEDDWWMLASEGAVFAEGDTTTIYLSNE